MPTSPVAGRGRRHYGAPLAALGAKTVGQAAVQAPELRYLIDLLAAALREAPPPAAPDLDPGLLRRLIRHHRLEPWTHPLLSAAGLSPMQAALREDLQGSAQRRMALAQEMRVLCAAFAEAGVPALALKGPALSLQLFGDPLRRASRDLDFLVPPGSEARARRVLADHGYGQTAADITFDANAVRLDHRDGKPPVELHSRFGEADILFPAAPLRLFDRPALLTLLGTEIATLPAEVAVAYAAFHGGTHFWSRLYWLVDIARACRLPGLDWPGVAAVARQTGTDRHLAVAVGLACDWLDSPPVLPAGTAGDRRAVRRFRDLVPLIIAPPLCSDEEAIRRISRWRRLTAEIGLARGGAKAAILLGRLPYFNASGGLATR